MVVEGVWTFEAPEALFAIMFNPQKVPNIGDDVKVLIWLVKQEPVSGSISIFRFVPQVIKYVHINFHDG
mgnify:CR=1 FL=1